MGDLDGSILRYRRTLCFNSIQRTVRREFIFLIVILYRFVFLIYDVSIVRSEKLFR